MGHCVSDTVHTTVLLFCKLFWFSSHCENVQLDKICFFSPCENTRGQLKKLLQLFSWRLWKLFKKFMFWKKGMPMLLLLGDPALTRFFHALQVERCQSYYCRRPLLFVPLVGLLKSLFGILLFHQNIVTIVPPIGNGLYFNVLELKKCIWFIPGPKNKICQNRIQLHLSKCTQKIVQQQSFFLP